MIDSIRILAMGKEGNDYYLDDKALNFEEFVS